MARGTTLGQLVVMLREEVGDATSSQLGLNNLPHMKRILARTQEFLWNDFAWPHLRVAREEVLQAGSRYYSLPADLSFDRVEERVDVRNNETWELVTYGITADHYNASDSENDEREDPVTRWQVYEGNQYEVWPLPATTGTAGGNGVLRFHGVRNLLPLIADADTADLDDNLIVLFAATEILGRRSAKDAKAKENLATRLYGRLKRHQTGQKVGMFIMGGGRDPHHGPFVGRPRPIYGART